MTPNGRYFLHCAVYETRVASSTASLVPSVPILQNKGFWTRSGCVCGYENGSFEFLLVLGLLTQELRNRRTLKNEVALN